MLASAFHESEHELILATGGLALELVRKVRPDLVILEVMMPGLDGLEVSRRIRALPDVAEVPVILVTALDDRSSRFAGLEAGADDFVVKPIDRVELRTRIRTTMRLKRSRKLHEALSSPEEAYEATFQGWVRALDLREYELERHSQRVAEMTVRLAWSMDFPADEILHIHRGALLHDIGKIAIPDASFRKAGPLDDAEWSSLRRHPSTPAPCSSPSPSCARRTTSRTATTSGGTARATRAGSRARRSLAPRG